MKSNAITGSILALALLLPLSACSQSGQAGTSSDATQAIKEAQKQTSSSFISSEVQKGIDKAKQDLVTQDIDVTNVRNGKGRNDDHDNRPKAVITPQGDLLIAGKKVDATPEQHAMLLDYRQQIIGIAEAGMDIGSRGADLGVNAAKTAILGAFTGKSDKEIEAAIKPQTDKIQAAAMQLCKQLCKQLPDLLTSQQKLAAAMPAFKPYATMQQKDVDNCSKDMTDRNGKKGVAIFSD